MGNDTTLEYLADFPHLADSLAEWFYDEWGRSNPNTSLEKTRGWVAGHANRGNLPMAFVAIRSGQPLGASCLRSTDLSSRPDLGPWLGSVYVVPEQRKRGLGSLLVKRAEKEAWKLGVSELFLFTYDQERLYASLGWSFLDHAENRGKPAVIMRKAA
jgi:GNAT superfamily N-acetyltransferase